MIVRDEEESLPRCLRSVRDVVDEMIIVDTGSTDRTMDIAREFGATVIEEPWTGDFAHHRNTSLNAATGDWVLILDADEELVDGAALRPLLNDPAMEGYSLREVNFIGESASIESVVNAAFRVYRNRPEYRYEGALHEQIQAKVDPTGGSCTRFVGIEILHYGYLDHTTEARNKKDRNMRIVLEEVRQKPDDAFTLFNAGVEFQRIDDHATALQYFTRAFSNLMSMRQYFASLLVRNLVASLKELGRYSEALEVSDDALEAYPDFTDLHYLRGQLYFARREYREAIAAFQRAIDLGDHAGDRYMSQSGMGSFYSWFALGTLHEALGDQAEAVRSYKRAITTARGLYLPPLVRLTQLLVRSDDIEEVEAFLRGILPQQKRAEALRTIGHVFLIEGHPGAARTLLEQSLQMEPDAHGTRVILAHCHLAGDDPATAATLLDQVPASSEAALGAAEKRVLVGLATGDLAQAERGVEAAEPGSPLAVGWKLAVDALRGDLPDAFAGDHARVEVTVFVLAEGMMELGRLEPFNALLPLLYRVSDDHAATDERLGHLLLRHGFDDPAADRLLSAVRADAASPETYAALGAVCARKGLEEDAEVFLRAALERDRQSMSRYLELAAHLAGRGRYEDAHEVLAAGLSVWPHSTVLRELGQSLSVLADVKG